MSNLDIIEALKEEFEELANCKPSASSIIRRQQFDDAVLAVYDGSEEFPKRQQLKSYFSACLRDKNNWGSNEVIKKLAYAINKVYARSN